MAFPPAIGSVPRSARWRPAAPSFLGFALILIALLILILPGPTLLGPHPTASGTSPAARIVPGVEPFVSRPLDTTTVGWTTFHGSENRSGFSPINGPAQENGLWPPVAYSGAPIRVAPVISANIAVAGDEFGHVFGYNLSANASKLWEYSLNSVPVSADIAGTYVVVAERDGTVTKLVLATGALAWAVGIGAPVVQAVGIAGASVYLATAYGDVEALALSDGHRLWATHLGASMGGAVAWENHRLYDATSGGTVVALDENGTVLWSTPLPDVAGRNVTQRPLVDTSPSVAFGHVVVADLAGNITALSASNGSVEWRYESPVPGDEFEATPALAQGYAVVQGDRGSIVSLDVANGTVHWLDTMLFSGYPITTSPAATPSGIYLIDAAENLDDVSPRNGAFLWQTPVGADASFSSPALDGGNLYYGNDVGYFYGIGPSAGPARYPTTGSVVDAATLAPIAGATVSVGSFAATTNSSGGFLLLLPNGSYTFEVTAPRYALDTVAGVLVSGPTQGLLFRLTALPLFPVAGFVRDSHSGRGLAGTLVTITGPWGYTNRSESGPDGSFLVYGPNGSDFLTVDPPPGYSGFLGHVTVAGPTAGVLLGLDPTGLTIAWPYTAAVFLPMLALAVAVSVGYLEYTNRLRAAEGLPPRIFTPMTRFITMRLLRVPGQVAAVLFILYVFGTFFPAAARNLDPCSLSNHWCTTCNWSNFGCLLTAFTGGFWQFLSNMFTGNWGLSHYGSLQLPSTTFLAWWAPDSVELGVISLLIAAAIAYPVGLFSGWRRDSVVDVSVRTVSLLGLLIPSFILVLLLLGGVYTPFVSTFHDDPYGLLPGQVWFQAHGGEPSWIGIGLNTSPTGFPLVDGAIHGDWAFEELVLAKTLVQALLIALLYAAIFLRFARNAVAEIVGDVHITAARGRGVAEPTLLWHHTARRVLPLYVLVFAITLPAYLGAQALVEALFGDTGVGTLLLGEMTHVTSNQFGFSATQNLHPGNFYQVTIFLLVFVVLIANLISDVLARALDPRLRGEGPT